MVGDFHFHRLPPDMAGRGVFTVASAPTRPPAMKRRVRLVLVGRDPG